MGSKLLTTLAGGRISGTDRPTVIRTRAGLIISIGDLPGYQEEAASEVTVDVTGLTVAPGLIDLQINGAYGSDFTSEPETIWKVGARLPEQGVTAFLPTIISSPLATVDAAKAALGRRPAGYQGAEPLGLHLEGPMLSAKRPGVHDPGLMRLPSLELIEGWSSGSGVAMVTMAPELPGSQPVIEALINAGVIVSAGHTAATLKEGTAGFEWGMSVVTHLFNAMEPFDHRAPGLIGAVIKHPKAVAGLIADGIHSDPAAVLAAWRWLGPSRLALVTDAMAATGLGDGNYELGRIQVAVRNGRASTVGGRLAGSTLTMDQAVRNLVDFAACSEAEALAAASAVPASALGLRDRGSVVVGARADLVVLDDSMKVVATMVGGDFAYLREDWEI